jgi:hypothetical protein
MTSRERNAEPVLHLCYFMTQFSVFHDVDSDDNVTHDGDKATNLTSLDGSPMQLLV